MTEEFSFAPDGTGLREARAKARAAAVALGATARIGDTVALVVDELANNAIEHGAAYRRAALPLRVRLSTVPSGLAIEFFDREMPAASVRDLHDALEQASAGAPTLDSERGRGLFLLTVYLEAVGVEVAEGGGMCLRGVVPEEKD